MCCINTFSNNNKNCNDCEQAKKAFLEYSSKLSNENERYTSLVAGIWYVSYIALISSIFSNLCIVSKKNLCCCVVFIVISLALFIIYEIWKIKASHKYQYKIYNKIKAVLINGESFSYSDLTSNIEGIELEHYSNIFKATPWIFGASCITSGISVVFFLIYIGIVFAQM